MRARSSSASLRELVPVIEPADQKDGFFSRWNKSRALIAASGVRGAAVANPETTEDAAREKARLAGKRQALALAAGVSATVWLSLAVSVFFAVRAGHGISAP